MDKHVLVIGGGIAGMQAALLLADKNYQVLIADSAPAIGGFFPLLEKQFPTNTCGVCAMSIKSPMYCPIYESTFHENIEILTQCGIESVNGQAGDFEVSYNLKPRYIDEKKCTLCGKCADVCPVETANEFGGGIEKRKAVYLPFPRAIPRCYVIDGKSCTRCGKCVEVCEPGAVNLEEAERSGSLRTGAIILGFGFETFHAETKGEYGLNRYANVVTGVQYEHMLCDSSSTGGLPRRPSDNNTPKKVAFLQCVGSRDLSNGNLYCSSICCMYSIKQAMVSKDLLDNFSSTVFYMDLRTSGKGYERYAERAEKEYGVQFVRSAVSSVRELTQSDDLLIEYALEDGQLRQEEFDMVVLATGVTIPDSTRAVAKRLGVKLNDYGFCETEELRPTETSVPGIFVAGSFREPSDISETVVQACSASVDAEKVLDTRSADRASAEGHEFVGNELTKRVAVFICDSRGMLAGSLHLDKLVEDIGKERKVICVERVDITSLEDGLNVINDTLNREKINRAVIAGYRGVEIMRYLRKHSPAFQSYPQLAELVNIGEHCADIHSGSIVFATEQAGAMVKAGLKKVLLVDTGQRGSQKLVRDVLVLGGGVTGLVSSLTCAERNLKVTLVEQSRDLGGNAATAYYTAKGTDVQRSVGKLVNEVRSHPGINVLTEAELQETSGRWGDFHSRIAHNGDHEDINHGALIIATGGSEVKPTEYLYGQNPRVVTQKTFERLLATGDREALSAGNIVMIQCVESRDENRPYCSRVCCSHAVKNSLRLKQENPEANIYVLNRDIRTYGFYEEKYLAARDRGVIFVRYEPADKPVVLEKNGSLFVSFQDPLLKDRVNVKADFLVLSVGIEVRSNSGIADTIGLDLDGDGFFMGRNPKAAPLDSSETGIYMAGLCQAPIHMEEAVCQARAAAARAAALLYHENELLIDHGAYVDERFCSGCGECEAVCPAGAAKVDTVKMVSTVDASLCQGCGLCAASCRSLAIHVRGYSEEQVLDALGVLL